VTVLGAAVVAVVLCLVVVGIEVGRGVVVRHRVAAAADLAAVGAASFGLDGEWVACGKAALVAERMGVELVECELVGVEARVLVRGPVLVFGAPSARARAGPGEPVVPLDATNGRLPAVSGLTHRAIADWRAAVGASGVLSAGGPPGVRRSVPTSCRPGVTRSACHDVSSSGGTDAVSKNTRHCVVVQGGERKMEWSDSWRGAFRIELRAEAVNLAWHGWPVLPGTYPAGAQWAGREGVEQDGPVPVHRDWQERIGTKAEQVATWWAGRSYSILLATGHGVDAIEVGADLGRRAAVALRATGIPVPIVATPSGRWMFLVTTGQALRADWVAEHDVHHYGKGEYVPLPPTTFQHGVVHWRVKPQICAWQLPQPGVVQDALTEAVHAPADYGLLTADRA
jgi:secretion/DNA translocation related TadE-like protein